MYEKCTLAQLGMSNITKYKINPGGNKGMPDYGGD